MGFRTLSCVNVTGKIEERTAWVVFHNQGESQFSHVLIITKLMVKRSGYNARPPTANASTKGRKLTKTVEQLTSKEASIRSNEGAHNSKKTLNLFEWQASLSTALRASRRSTSLVSMSVLLASSHQLVDFLFDQNVT